MKASDVKLAGLKTFMDCSDAVSSIEGNPHNYHGGMKRWLSGKETFLKESAKTKIASIWMKANRFETND